MTAAFQPVGETARWKLLYDLLMVRDVGDVVTYDQMIETLGIESLARIRSAFRRAAAEYERHDNRAVEAVPGIGYRIVRPVEHLRLAQRQQRKSSKALVRSRSKIVHVDRNGLDPEVIQAFEVTGQALALMISYVRRLDLQQKSLQQAVSGMADRQTRSESEVAELRARLARLEAQIDP